MNRIDNRDFDIVVLGATGLTGRLVAAYLSDRDTTTGLSNRVGRWAVAGRDRRRLESVVADVGAAHVPAIIADVTDPASLHALAARTTVLLNLAGPYTPGAEAVIEACIAARTSYVDLSGEIPLLQRVNRRFDAAARDAGIAVVQMAGWEALPADVVTLLASREAVGDDYGPDGPGANHPITSVEVTTRFTRRPEGGAALGESVSAGTLASIVAMLSDDGSGAIGDTAALLPDADSADATRAVSPLHLLPDAFTERVRGPVVPVAFLNPPIIHRTAALLAGGRGADHEPASYDEGNDLGPKNPLALLEATALAAVQRTFIGIARIPAPIRRLLAGGLRRIVPESGSGPSGRFLTDWSWEVRATATSTDGGTGEASLTGTGHPGYTATAAMIAALGVHLAEAGSHERRFGCLTPALAFGAEGALSALSTDELLLRVTRTGGRRAQPTEPVNR